MFSKTLNHIPKFASIKSNRASINSYRALVNWPLKIQIKTYNFVIMNKRDFINMTSRFFFLTLVFGSMFFVNCTDKTEKNKQGKATGEEVIAVLDSLFYQLDNPEESAPGVSEDKVRVNENIRRTIENIRSSRLLAEIGKAYTAKSHKFSFVLSEDKKIGVFSWRTQMDASGNKIKNIALYQTADKVEPSSLYDIPIIYGKIYQVESYRGETLYILHGHDSTGNDKYFRLNAYTLKNESLEEAPAFPNNESSISISQIHKKPELSDPLGFKVEMNGARILFPEIQGTSTVEHSLAFDGKKYVQK